MASIADERGKVKAFLHRVKLLFHFTRFCPRIIAVLCKIYIYNLHFLFEPTGGEPHRIPPGSAHPAPRAGSHRMRKNLPCRTGPASFRHSADIRAAHPLGRPPGPHDRQAPYFNRNFSKTTFLFRRRIGRFFGGTSGPAPPSNGPAVRGRPIKTAYNIL